MGFWDALLGGRRKVEGPRETERLFAMSTAAIALEAEHGLVHRERAGIVFQPLPTADFAQIAEQAEALLRSAAEDTGTTVTTSEDGFGYRWVVLADRDFEDLVVSLNTVASELEAGGYGDRLLCAVFAFTEGEQPVYLIYNFKRARYYPFVPAGERRRDTERELRLQARLSNELPIEPELERWFPLWDIPL